MVAGFAVLLFLQLRKKEEVKKDDEALKIMMEWMKEIKQGTESSKHTTEQNIKDLNKAINERLDNAGKVISALTRELGGVSQIGPDIRRLTETLTSPKLRGNFGEEILETHNYSPEKVNAWKKIKKIPILWERGISENIGFKEMGEFGFIET